MFLSCTGVRGGRVLDNMAVEAPIKHALIAASHRIVLLASELKFPGSGALRLCSLDEVDVLITTPGTPEEEISQRREAAERSSSHEARDSRWRRIPHPLRLAGVDPRPGVAQGDRGRPVRRRRGAPGHRHHHPRAACRRLHRSTHVRTDTELEPALEGADFVFAAIRVGGVEQRCCDEHVALDLNVLGQETTGPGGIAYALRTLPVILEIAETIRRVAPKAYFLNFTNPAGIITEALQGVLGDRALGICDTPSGLGRRVAGVLGYDHTRIQMDYVGLNHLGWMRRCSSTASTSCPPCSPTSSDWHGWRRPRSSAPIGCARSD